MVHCAVYNCGSNSSKKSEKNISFYQLPKNENGQYDENAEKWKYFCKRPKTNLPPDKNIRICHKHFSEDAFESDLMVRYNMFV